MLKEQILKIKNENPTFGYKKIAKVLNCASSTVRFHLQTKSQNKSYERRNKNRRKSLTKLKQDFGGKCKICNYNKCLDALHFHHNNPKNKSGTVSEILNDNGVLAAYKEAKKCQLICANCHAELHSN